MVLKPPFSSQVEEASASDVASQTLAISSLETLKLHEPTTGSTPTMKASEVTTAKAKVDTAEDPWKNGTKEESFLDKIASKDNRPNNFTLKGKNQSDSWMVIYYDTIQDALDILDDPQLEELMDKIAEKNSEFAARFGGSSSFSKPAAKSSGGWGAKKPAAKKSYSRSEPEYDDAYDCEHGEREWVDKGTWRAWMCPTEDRDDKCEPLWANADGSLQPKKRR